MSPRLLSVCCCYVAVCTSLPKLVAATATGDGGMPLGEICGDMGTPDIRARAIFSERFSSLTRTTKTQNKHTCESDTFSCWALTSLYHDTLSVVSVMLCAVYFLRLSLASAACLPKISYNSGVIIRALPTASGQTSARTRGGMPLLNTYSNALVRDLGLHTAQEESTTAKNSSISKVANKISHK